MKRQEKKREAKRNNKTSAHKYVNQDNKLQKKSDKKIAQKNSKKPSAHTKRKRNTKVK